MGNKSMKQKYFGKATMKPSHSPLNVHVSSISDLPPEVMALIFEELNCIDRRKMERVCKGWRDIIRGVKKFRTHLIMEFPSYLDQGVDGYSKPSLGELCARVCHLAYPDLEVLHFKSLELQVESAQFDQIRHQHGIFNIQMALRYAGGVDLSKVDIVFTDCTLDCAILAGHTLREDTRKIRIIRTNLTVGSWFGAAALYFEELLLETPNDQLPMQIGNLFLAEHGPPTEEQWELLREVKRHIPDHPMAIFLWVIRLDAYGGFKYVDGNDWQAALTTIGNGGYVSKYTADFLMKAIAPAPAPDNNI